MGERLKGVLGGICCAVMAGCGTGEVVCRRHLVHSREGEVVGMEQSCFKSFVLSSEGPLCGKLPHLLWVVCGRGI